MPDTGFGTPPGPTLSNATPQALGSANAGTSTLASRADHVHAAPAIPSVPGAGTTPPLVDAPSAAVGSSTAYAREDHVHPIFPITPSTPSRVLGTAFQPSATKYTLVIYSIRTQVTNPLLAGSSTATVQLMSDTNTTPTTERGRVAAESSVGVAVAIAITTANTAQLSYLVPPGHYVRLVSTVTGTGATSIIRQTEEAFG